MHRRASLIAAAALWLATAGAAGAQSIFHIEVTPRHVTTADRVVFDLSGIAAGADCVPAFQAPDIYVPSPSFTVRSFYTIAIQQANLITFGCSHGPWQQRIEIPPLTTPGIYLVQANSAPQVATTYPVLGAASLLVEAPQAAAALQGRFTAKLAWTDANGAAHSATAVQLSPNSAYFWLFEPANIDLTVKMVDGRAVNGHYWVFIASMTDVAFDLALTEQVLGCGPNGPACPTQHYVNPAHQNRNVIDINAFGS